MDNIQPSDPPGLHQLREPSLWLRLAPLLLQPENELGPCLVPTPSCYISFLLLHSKRCTMGLHPDLTELPFPSASALSMPGSLQSALQEALYLAYSHCSIMFTTISANNLKTAVLRLSAVLVTQNEPANFYLYLFHRSHLHFAKSSR